MGKELAADGIFEGEDVLQERWRAKVEEVISQTDLTLPAWNTIAPVLGGRQGKHSEHLTPLLDEMGEVFRIDPTASW